MIRPRPEVRDLAIEPGRTANLAQRSTRVTLPAGDRKVLKSAARDELRDVVHEIAALQERLYATGRHAILVVFQAMDAAGKDSTINHVLSGINPQGCRVTSFKQPTAEEVAHDFLWRSARALPARGHIGVFNRSHYEETLVARVHPEFLGPQRLPGDPTTPKQLAALWQQRYEDINAFERHVDRSGTRILKFFLHVSKEEQRQRFLARIDDPDKQWKFNAADLSERARWDDYQVAYEQTLTATSTTWAPWHVVPADDKPTMRLLVADGLLATLRELDLRTPEPTPADLAAMATARDALLAEA